MRWWPVAHSSPSTSPGPIAGALSGVPGRSPARAATSSSSPTSGSTSQAASSSRKTPSAVTAVSKPCSSCGRAEHDAAVGARDEVAARRAHDVASRRAEAAPHAQLEQLPLDRPHRRRRGLGRQRPLGAPGAGGDQHRAGGDRLALVEPGDQQLVGIRRGIDRDDFDAADTAAGGVEARHLDADAQLATGGGEGGGQRANDGERVDVAVLRRVDRAADPRRQTGLAPACGARPEPLGVESELDLEGVQAAQLLGVVAVGGDDQRAASRVAGRQRGQLLELGGEGGPQVARGEVELEQRLLAEGRLGHRGEHARRDARGTGARGVALDHQHRHAGLGAAPGAAEADRSGADHD